MLNRKRASLKEVVEMAKQLSPRDRVRLIGLLAPSIERELPDMHQGPRRSLYALCADLGSAPSAEDIDEARRDWIRALPT